MTEFDFDELFAEAKEEVSKEMEDTEDVTPEEVEEDEDLEGAFEDVDDEEEVEEDEEPEVTPEDKQAVKDLTKAELEALNQTINRQKEGLINQRLTIAEQAKQLNILKNVAEEFGITVEELLANTEKSVIKAKAEKQGVPEDVIRSQREQQKQINELQRSVEQANMEKQRIAFDSAFNEFSKDIPLTPAEIDDFFAKAVQSGINLVTNPTEKSLRFAYYAVYPEKQEEIIRQKILRKTKEKAKKNPINPTASGGKVDKTAEEEYKKWEKGFFRGTEYEDKIK